MPQINMDQDADAVRSAMKGFGTNERALISILPRLDPIQIASLNTAYQARHRRDLKADLKAETSSYFRQGLVSIASGPLDSDVNNLNNAIKGLGTKESVLNTILLSRSNADIHAIKARYRTLINRDLDRDVAGDLSAKTQRLFTMVLAGNRAPESTPIDHRAIEADVSDLYRATEGHSGTGADQISVCAIFTARSDGQLRAISHAYHAKYHRALLEVIKKSFTGHMEDALVYILRAAEDRARLDADLLEETMKGMGTKDEMLVERVVALHWDRERLGQARRAYRHWYKTELVSRIKGEVRGDYERLMVAVVESA